MAYCVTSLEGEISVIPQGRQEISLIVHIVFALIKLP